MKGILINIIKQAITDKLLECYPDCIIYDEVAVQDFSVRSFLINLVNQESAKRIKNKYTSTFSFDVSYFSDKQTNEIRADCLEVQQNLFRELDVAGTFRILNKKAGITENILHFTFDIRCSELNTIESEKMQQVQTNTIMEG